MVRKSAMTKAISGHSAPNSGMAMAIAAIPVAPSLSQRDRETRRFGWRRDSASKDVVSFHFLKVLLGQISCSVHVC